MYLTGMGGTGKSQVIKVLMEFFKHKNELHCIVVLGPTGSSAALINGSTYHSFFGINPGPNTTKKINEVKTKLESVDYIFIDEVSMMSCQDMLSGYIQSFFPTGQRFKYTTSSIWWYKYNFCW